jgi:hypothetical protein
MTTDLERANEIAGRKLTDKEANDLTVRTVAADGRPLWARVRDTLWGKPPLPPNED